MPQFDVSSFSSQLFWLIVVFALLYFLVSKFIAPKAEYILTVRNRCLEENIHHAEEYNNMAKLLNTSRFESLAAVNVKIEDIQKQVTKMLDAHFNKQKDKLVVILDKKRKKALSDINNYVDKFHSNESQSCVSLAAFIIQKITDKPANLKLLEKIHRKTK